MGVSVIPEVGYTTSGMTADDIMFVQDYTNISTDAREFVPDTSMHDFVLKDGVFYTVVHVTDYDEIREKAAISAGNMPETAARKLMAEDYLVDGSVKFSAMSEHQLSVYDREDFVHDETAEFLGIPSGIILSSGDASSALEGDYDDGGRTGSYNEYYNFDGDSSYGDADLYEEFDEYPQYDTATLEFTVKAPDKSYPLSMTFNYAYATQEMDEDPEYNDVFALFVSQGKDSPDAESVFSNYATMKTDTQGSIGKVTVSNMKAAIQAADEAADDDGNFYVSENSGVKFVDGAYEDDGEFGFDTLEEYGLLFNGLTDVYSTTVSGIEGGKYYTIKIAIADASDSMVDGAVFLQANSLYFGIEAPIVTGLSHYGVTKAVEQPEINLGVKQYGKVYIVPAGQPYTTEDALKNAASKVWRNDYKNGIVINLGAFDLSGYAYSEDVSVAGLRTGNYAAYLVAEYDDGHGGLESVVSLPSETFYVSPYIASLPGNFLNRDIDELLTEMTINYGFAEYDDDTKTLSVDDIEYVTSADVGVVLPEDTTMVVSGDSMIEVRNNMATVFGSEGSLELQNNGSLELTTTAEEGAGLVVLGDNFVISGNGTTKINAPYGIMAMNGGNVTLNGDVVINCSEIAITCNELSIPTGSLTINMFNGLDGAFSDSVRLDDPEGYEIIGGTIESDGTIIPDEYSTQLIIRKKSKVNPPYYPPYTPPVYPAEPVVTPAPVIPAEPVAEEYAIPVKNEDTIQVEAEIKDKNATVEDISKADIDKILAKNESEETSAKEEAIIIDFYNAMQEVESVTLSKKTVDNLAEATANGQNSVNAVEIKFTGSTITLDSKAVEAVKNCASDDGDSIVLVVANNSVSSLNSAQRAALKAADVAAVIDAHVECNGVEVKGFSGGNMQIAIKFEVEPGRMSSHYFVEYVAEDGTRTRLATRYSNGRLVFETTHLSDYVIVYDESAENGTYKWDDVSPAKAEDADAMPSTAQIKKNTLRLNKQFKVVQSGDSINTSWGKVDGADGYIVYASYCGSKAKKIKTIKDADVTDFEITQLNGADINLKKNYKVVVKAYKVINGKKVVIAKSIYGHAVGSRNSKYTDAKSIRILSDSKLILNKGESSAIEAETILINPSKKQLSDAHAKEFRYASADESVATVADDGTITAVGTGKCNIYIYARNGLAKKVTVVVEK